MPAVKVTDRAFQLSQAAGRAVLFTNTSANPVYVARGSYVSVSAYDTVIPPNGGTLTWGGGVLWAICGPGLDATIGTLDNAGDIGGNAISGTVSLAPGASVGIDGTVPVTGNVGVDGIVTTRSDTGVPYYGTGADGIVTLTGAVTLTRDMDYESLTIPGIEQTNLFWNPRLFSVGTYWGNGTRVTNAPANQWSGTTAMLRIANAGSGTGVTLMTVAPENGGSTVAGVTYTYSVDVYVSSAIVGPALYLQVTATSFTSSNVNVDMSLRDQWQRVYITFTSPNGGSTLLRLKADNLSVGGNVYMTAALGQIGTTNNPYFDGAMTNTPTKFYSWAGTAHASESRLADGATIGSLNTAGFIVRVSNTASINGAVANRGANGTIGGSLTLGGATGTLAGGANATNTITPSALTPVTADVGGGKGGSGRAYNSISIGSAGGMFGVAFRVIIASTDTIDTVAFTGGCAGGPGMTSAPAPANAGGGGGGVVVIFARYLTLKVGSIINVSGGNGADQSNNAYGASGGGGGGTALTVYETKTGQWGSILVNGGVGGSGGSGTDSSGFPGRYAELALAV